ncbi:MAG: ABC transporter substrate-binding protein [Treponema sp.]|jgi:iron complex transport system substrate-binding protein|nr:ABC transporter substrate-binding protein [Treponema sp.]
MTGKWHREYCRAGAAIRGFGGAFWRVFLAAFFCALCAACGKTDPQPAGDRRTVTDPMGFTVTFPSPPERIISSAPSNTEIIAMLGMGGKLIAIDKYSLGIESIGVDLPAIDFVYPDAEAIVRLNPDLIIASEHNRVSGGDPFKLLRDMGIATVYLPTSGGIDEIYRDITFIADILEVPEKGAQMKEAMKAGIEKTAAVGKTITEKRTVYFEISPLPGLVSFGKNTFLDEMIGIIGAENIFADQTGWIAPGGEAVIERNPDVILTNTAGGVLPESSGLRTEAVIAEIKARPGFGGIAAVRNGRVYHIDANSSARPGPNIVKALKEMARAVYPEYYE